MSPLGSYPEETFLGTTSALATAPDICFSIVRLHRGLEHWDFSEVDTLSPVEVPLLAALTLAVDEGERYIEPYPTHQAIYLRASSDRSLDAATVEEAREWIRAYVKRHKLEQDVADIVHRPPVAGGHEYDTVPSRNRDVHRNAILQLLESADPVTLRGLSALLKANMAWAHRELNEAACISLWISLDAVHSLVLHTLRRKGKTNPTSRDASDYVSSLYGADLDEDDSLFKYDYENRIRLIHPDSKFGAEARPQLLADDFYELRHVVIELFHLLVTGAPTKSSPGDSESHGHAYHRRPL